MKRFLKSGLVGLFLLLLFLGGITSHAIIQAQSYGRLINYVGIVRGGSQRLVKLELENQPNDQLVDYLDEILDELTGGEGSYDLPNPSDGVYQKNLSDLMWMWTDVKEQIKGYRSGGENRDELLAISEKFFNQANDTVFSAEDYSSRQIEILLVMCIGMFMIMLVIWVFIFWANSKNMLQLEDTNKTLKDLTKRDMLTSAYNLNSFKEEAQQLLDAKPKRKFAVVYTDFSDFKYINDVFGYNYGDRVLIQYVKILRDGLREGELLGRVSADNFVLLLCYQKKEEIVMRQEEADEKIMKYMQNSYTHQSLPTCCGICCLEDVDENLKIEGLLDRANFARKTVKNGTNANYVFYNENIRRRLQEEKNVESQMYEALESREFIVYYQPKVELKTGKIACSEALVRWRTQDGTIIPPDRFIPVFERKFMINRLDQYVFEEVCRWLRHLLDQGKKALPVSVNVSRLQFYDQNFVRHYVEIRDRYQIPPELLEIEFTESIVFDNTELMIQIVNQLRKEGFTCSIDDFGKGYSSLSLLKNLTVDTLKIDSLFFVNGNNRERDWAVVQGIIELVKKFHIHVVAEGIESEEQVEFLKRIGCDYVQGYVFYRPIPQESYEKLL